MTVKFTFLHITLNFTKYLPFLCTIFWISCSLPEENFPPQDYLQCLKTSLVVTTGGRGATDILSHMGEPFSPFVLASSATYLPSFINSLTIYAQSCLVCGAQW